MPRKVLKSTFVLIIVIFSKMWFPEVCYVKDSFDVDHGQYLSLDTLKAQIMIDMYCMPGWI